MFIICTTSIHNLDSTCSLPYYVSHYIMFHIIRHFTFDFKMKKFIITTLLVLFVFSLFQGSAFAYGYKGDEDPLLKVFKSTVYYGRKNNWGKVENEIRSIGDRIGDVNDIFGIDLGPKFAESIGKEDFQLFVNNMVQLVILAIREKFYWNRKEKLKIVVKSKVRIRLAKEYYVKLLSGNVRKLDVKNNTNINDQIYQYFDDVVKTIGSFGFFGVAGIEPDLKKFNAITNEIEGKISSVFSFTK